MLLPRVQTAEDKCIDVLERHTQKSSFVARAGGRQHASMGLYSAIGPDEYSYASARYSVVRIGVGEREKGWGTAAMDARFGTVFSALPACGHIAS